MTDVPTTELTNADLTPVGTPITTGASPVTADVDVRIYAITTGGTEGVEVIDLPLPGLPVDGQYNPMFIGQKIVFYLAALTEPTDSVQITVDGSGNIPVFRSDNNPFSVRKNVNGGVIFDTLGNIAAFIWCGDAWKLDRGITGENDASAFYDEDMTVTVQSGKTLNINLSGGTLNISGFPTADPLNSGEVYTDGAPAPGVPQPLMVSGGAPE